MDSREIDFVRRFKTRAVGSERPKVSILIEVCLSLSNISSLFYLFILVSLDPLVPADVDDAEWN